MKHRPILFKGDMVRAILDGRKTQARRDVRPQPDADGISYLTGEPFRPWPNDKPNRWHWPTNHGASWAVCPYEPGDLLWVETEDDEAGSPSIYMPTPGTGLWLHVTGVRVEQVQEIDSVDALAEGVCHSACACSAFQHRGAFERLWDSLNAEHGHGWDTNPWVWVVEFERCEAPA